METMETIALVTGANKGIGHEVARLLGEAGAVVLVNNAGIVHPADLQGPSATPLPVMREIFETNVFGVVAVTNAMLPLLRRSPGGRIVNLSSELASFAMVTDPDSPWYPYNMLAYNAGKSALNAITVAYAKELAGTPIKVNAGNPGHCATDLNGHTGTRSPAEGAAEIVRLATLDADGPTGGFFRDGEPMPW